MTNAERDIENILHFRTDVSPFLVHLTRSTVESNAKSNLENILKMRQLKAGKSEVSAAKFGMKTSILNDDTRRRFFEAVCFTETPLDEIHCLLHIGRRHVNLEPFGLVFLKDKVIKKGIEPVWYLNNVNGDKDVVVQALCELVEKNPEAAEKILPLVACFGQKLQPPHIHVKPQGTVDFKWEREWRYAACRGDFSWTIDDVFVGLCPDQEIDYFENLLPDVPFIDPQKNAKWYGSKLVAARQRSDLKYSVV